jgi:hypothetical protein
MRGKVLGAVLLPFFAVVAKVFLSSRATINGWLYLNSRSKSGDK